MLPSFLVYGIWKEHNSNIFYDQEIFAEATMGLILKLLNKFKFDVKAQKL